MMALLSYFKSKPHDLDNADSKKRKQQEKQQGQDEQRQKNPNGLLEIALKSGFRRQSFTAADPSRFYQGHKHTTDAENNP